MKLPEISVGFGFRTFTGYRSAMVFLPALLIRLGRSFACHGQYELSVDWGFKDGRVLEGETPWLHSWRVRVPRAPLRLIWVREYSRAAEWTGRVRRCIGFELGWGYNRRLVYFG